MIQESQRINPIDPPKMPSSDSTLIEVALGPRSYPIEVTQAADAYGTAFETFIQQRLKATWAGQGCQKALIITDSNVIHPWSEKAAGHLQAIGLEILTMCVPAGESSKSLETLSRVYDSLMDLKADRHTLVLAVGGGVIGDLAGFAAASFNRGLPLIMVPTTLLSQVDSSVGGKTGVNHPRGKNLIGAFHQPIGVWISVQTLSTLPDREFRSGLAEVVKYGVIQDPAFFDWLEAHADSVLARDPAALAHVISRSCRLKADVVEQDEFEHSGLRAILNFGHTVAHSIENIAGYGQYLHGEAVSIGMIAETILAEKLGWIGSDIIPRLSRLLERFGLPTDHNLTDHEALLAAMRHDKKNRSGRIRFVIPRAIGRVEMTDAADDFMILSTLKLIQA